MKKLMLLLLLFTISRSYSQVNLNLGLRAYYPFTGNANDASGNNNNPVFNNATLTADQYGNANSAYHFNGINNYMMIPNSPSLNMGKSISICAKVKPTGFYTGRCQNNMLLSKGDGDFLPGTYNLRFADPVLGCTEDPPRTKEVFYGGGAVAASPYINLNQWYNVVCTYDGTTAKIYVDCILRAVNKISQGSFISSYNLYIGHLKHPQYPYWLNGDLDEIRIYDRALNQDEVTALCNKETPDIITAFKTSVINNKLIKLTWDTKTTLVIKSYSIERSVNKTKEFTTIGSVLPKTKPGTNAYIFFDSTAKNDVLYYYKIKINTDDGQSKYTVIRTGRIITNSSTALDLTNPVVPEDITAGNIDNTVGPETTVAFEEKNKQPENIQDVAKAVLERKNDVQETIYFSADSLEISLFDNGQIDGDTVSVLMNGNIIIAKQLLKATAFRKMIAMPAGTDSIQLVMYAENLGTIPPNTGLLVVKDGKDIHEVRFSGDMQKNAMVILRRRKL